MLPRKSLSLSECPDVGELSQLEGDIDIRRGEDQDGAVTAECETRLEDQVLLPVTLREHDADEIRSPDLLLQPADDAVAGDQVIGADRYDVPSPPEPR